MAVTIFRASERKALARCAQEANDKAICRDKERMAGKGTRDEHKQRRTGNDASTESWIAVYVGSQCAIHRQHVSCILNPLTK